MVVLLNFCKLSLQWAYKFFFINLYPYWGSSSRLDKGLICKALVKNFYIFYKKLKRFIYISFYNDLFWYLTVCLIYFYSLAVVDGALSFNHVRLYVRLSICPTIGLSESALVCHNKMLCNLYTIHVLFF